MSGVATSISSLTDMVRKIDNGPALIEKWLRNKNTIEFLGIWEEMYNADFNTAAYEEIMLEAGLNRFIMSVKHTRIIPDIALFVLILISPLFRCHAK